VDCPSGEDEESCNELETNECEPLTEYRCKNGQCIPKDFFFDGTWDCLDKTDEIREYNEFCHINMLWYCEDSICDPYTNSLNPNGLSMSFTCGDGQCIDVAITDQSYSSDHASSFTCGSGRHILYTQRLFESTNECLEYVKCAFKFELFKEECQLICKMDLYCHLQIKLKCANQSLITFPLKPIFDNHVFLVYELNRTKAWDSSYIPSFICFDSKRCPQYKITHTIDGRTCSLMKEFGEAYLDRYYGVWQNVYVMLQTIFGGCSLPSKNCTILIE
jgi:hypothetical protein